MIIVEILIVLALTLLNGVLAMSELAIVSSRRARLDHMAKNGKKGARRAIRLFDDPARFLSTVQIGITSVGILAGAYSGATIADQLGDWLDTFPQIAPHGDNIAIGLVVLGITYVSLIVGELVPKRIAMSNPEGVAVLVAPAMDLLSRVASPAVWVLRRSTETILRVLGLDKSSSQPVTEEEVKSLIAEGTRAGTFEPQEKEMIEGVLRLADRTVRTVMTPRADIYWLDLNDSPEFILQELEEARYSRLLVCDGSIDNAVGTVTTKDALAALLRGKTMSIRDLMRTALLVPESTAVLRLLDRFKTHKVHMGVVVDEHGVTQGLVTTTDVLESIAGNLPQPGDNAAPSMIQRGDGTWLVDGAVPIDEFSSRLDIGDLSDSGDFETVAGLVLHTLKHLPQPGEHFIHRNVRYEVVDMDGRRIDKLLVSRLSDADESG